MVLQFDRTFRSFDSQRFDKSHRLKHVTNIDKQLFNKSADSLVIAKKVY